nr:hypothetical protein BgiMline_002704 [Biomphalaria glabrata]
MAATWLIVKILLFRPAKCKIETEQTFSTDGQNQEGSTDGQNQEGSTDGQKQEGITNGQNQEDSTDGQNQEGSTDGQNQEGSSKKQYQGLHQHYLTKGCTNTIMLGKICSDLHINV